MLEEKRGYNERKYEEAFEYGRRLGRIESKFLRYMSLKKSIKRTIKALEKLPSSLDTSSVVEKLLSVDEILREDYAYSEDMDRFIEKYEKSGIRKLAERDLEESEYTYF